MGRRGKLAEELRELGTNCLVLACSCGVLNEPIQEFLTVWGHLRADQIRTPGGPAAFRFCCRRGITAHELRELVHECKTGEVIIIGHQSCPGFHGRDHHEVYTWVKEYLRDLFLREWGYKIKISSYLAVC